MKSYYVSSGDIHKRITANTERAAAIDFVSDKTNFFGSIVVVSEKEISEEEMESQVYFDTDSLLNAPEPKVASND